jgi:hypothetical protein
MLITTGTSRAPRAHPEWQPTRCGHGGRGGPAASAVCRCPADPPEDRAGPRHCCVPWRGTRRVPDGDVTVPAGGVCRAMGIDGSCVAAGPSCPRGRRAWACRGRRPRPVVRPHRLIGPAPASPHWPGLHREQLTAGTAAARPGDRPRRASAVCRHPEWACPARPSRPPSPALWSPVAAVGDPCRPAADPARATPTRAVPVRAAGLARHSCRQPGGRSRCRPDPA